MNDENRRRDFIRAMIDEHNSTGRFNRLVHTRFPPEPNGYLHIGHAKSFCLNFGIASEYGGKCNLRFDDTNPAAEDTEYVESIKEDVRWLGYDWQDRLYYASDYFDRLFEGAVRLVKAGKAYVDDQSAEEIRVNRGSLTHPGKSSPFRDRSADENLDLFMRMKAGEFADGSRVLRARIDMASPNINMRDPVMYRIQHAKHHRTGDAWCIYPMYDFAHGLCDSYEGITHSICTLEFEDHRPLYDWFLDQLDVHHPQQIEFARLNISNTILSKRKLLELVNRGYVDGWDDPRMPTLSGLRRRGYSPASIRNFTSEIGVAKTDSIINIAMLEHCARVDLNRESARFMAVLDPVKLVITNYPADREETMKAVNNPEKPEAGTRDVPFDGTLYIERSDFMENPPKKFYRLAPGREVRLRYAYFIKCTDIVRNPETGEIEEIRCTYDPATRGGDAPDGRKVRATLHWVSARHSINAVARHYDHLFTVENPDNVPEGKSFTDFLNPGSLEIIENCKIEPAAARVAPGTRIQFERQGYYVSDNRDHSTEKPVFNRTVGLRDDWARLQKRMKG